MSHTHSGHLASELIETGGTGRDSEKFPAIVRIGILVSLSATLWAGIYFAATSLVGLFG